jgi:hypothetical protein
MSTGKVLNECFYVIGNFLVECDPDLIDRSIIDHSLIALIIPFLYQTRENPLIKLLLEALARSLTDSIE